jgi:AAA ATPase domain
MLQPMARAKHSFVGREREIDELVASLDDALAGRGGVWLVSGEPGIGKSRLLEEVARVAADRDVQVAWGRCWEAGGAPAYWPFIQLLRALLARRSAAAPPLIGGTLATEIAALLPELGGSAAPASSLTSLEPEQARFRLMDVVTRALLGAAQGAPLLLLLEDLHAADPSSLLLLSFLARQLRDARLCLIGTFREAEAQRAELSALFERLASDCMRLHLPRLNRAEVDAYLSRSLEPAPDAALCEAVFVATEGNPLFVGELARYCQRSGVLPTERGFRVPPGIRGTIHARLMLLAPETRAVLQVAAVIGRECRISTLRAAAERTSSELDAAIDEAIRAEVVLEVAPGVLRFSHVLLQQVLYDALADAQRRALHAALGARLEAEGASASERAHHLLAGGDEVVDQAALASLAAARESAERHALSEAARWYGLALSAKVRARANESERCELLLALGHAQLNAHELEAGRASCQQAAALARTGGDAERLARAALAYGAVYTIGEVQAPLVALLTEALAALPARDTPLRARVMARLSAAQQPAIDPEPPIELARQAIAMARRVGDQATLLSAIVAGCSAMMDLGDPAECRALEQEHVQLARALNEPSEEFRGSLRLVFTAYELGDEASAYAAIDACERLAERLGQPHFTWRVAALRAMQALSEGRFADAERHTEAARALGERAQDPNVARTYESQRAMRLRLMGRYAEAQPVLAALEKTLPCHQLGGLMTDLYMGAQLVAIGDDAGALARYRRLGDGAAILRADATLFDSLADLAALAGDEPTLRSLYAGLGARAERWATGGVFGFTWERPVQRSLGRLALAMDEPARALTHYRAALDKLRASSARAHHAWIAHEAAEVFRRAGDHAAGAELAREASALAAAHGIALPAREAASVAEPLASAASAPLAIVFRLERQGDLLRVVHAGRDFFVKDGKGFALLARLMEEPDRELHVLDLVQAAGAVDGGDAGELLDARARSAYRARLAELREDLAEAEACADLGRAERARAEIEQLEGELARALGLGGRTRRSGAAAERARVNVQRRLRDAIARIAEQDAALGRHLEWAVRTGLYCSYRTR